MNSRIDKLNENRIIPTAVNPNDVIFRKEKRINKLTSRFLEHKVLNDNKITLISTKKQKLHKS